MNPLYLRLIEKLLAKSTDISQFDALRNIKFFIINLKNPQIVIPMTLYFMVQLSFFLLTLKFRCFDLIHFFKFSQTK